MGDKLEEKTNTKYGNLEITVEGMDETQLAELMDYIEVHSNQTRLDFFYNQ